MASTRWRRQVALVVVAVVAVAGCGRAHEQPETVEVVRDMDLLEGAEAAGSARISWETDVELPYSSLAAAAGEDGDTGITIRTLQSAEGVVDLTTRASEWSGTYETRAEFPEGAVDEPLATPAQRFEVRTTATGEWFRSWADGDEPPGWYASDDEEVDEDVEDDPDEAAAPDTSLSDPTSFDPTVFFDALRAAADSVTVVGEEEVRGDRTTRSRAVVDAGDLDADGSLFAEDEGRVEVDVWIDEDDRLRRVETGGLRLELWDFGTPVAIEEPTDVVDDEDGPLSTLGLFPEVTGEFTEVSAGASDLGDWQVWAAPATARGTATTCRTLELAGDGPFSDALDGMSDLMGETLPIPHHNGHLADCGSGTFGLFTSTFVADPALQIVSDLVGIDDALVAFVVRDDLAAGGVRLVLDGSDAVELAVDAQGVAVWQATDDRLVAVDLDGGAVRCALPTFGDEAIDSAVGVLGMEGIGLAPCMRV